jgi:lipoyl-dependent peroxiredoxin
VSQLAVSRTIYTAVAKVTGCREAGHGRTGDGRLDVQLRAPGDAGGTNPEELFAVGYAGCFAQALVAVGRRDGVEIGETVIDSRVSLLRDQDGTFRLGVELQVTLSNLGSVAEAKRIVAGAHEICPYSNATRGNVDVQLTANGEPVTSRDGVCD